MDIATEPFVKWAGGKRQILDQLKDRMPKNYNRYFEPFVGGGALLFDLRPGQAYVNDNNRALINAYQMVRDKPDELLDKLHQLDNAMQDQDDDKSYYQLLRNRYNNLLLQGTYDVETAALLIFINKHCFNQEPTPMR